MRLVVQNYLLLDKTALEHVHDLTQLGVNVLRAHLDRAFLRNVGPLVRNRHRLRTLATGTEARVPPLIGDLLLLIAILA